jgi:hypothetical protein
MHVVGVQPHTFGLLGFPPPHVCGAGHVPQSMGKAAQHPPKVNVPQLSPLGHAVGHSQTHWPIGLHNNPEGHVPQLTVPPHPSGTVPQTCPAGHVVVGTHASAPLSAPPSTCAQTRLTSTPKKNDLTFSLQSSSPHSRPTWSRVHRILNVFSSCGRSPGQVTVSPVALPLHVTLPFVDAAERDNA